MKYFLSLPGPLVVDDSGLDPGLELGPRLGNEAGLAPLELVTPGLEIPVEGLKPSGDKDPGLELSVGVGVKKGVNGGDGKGDHGSSGGIGVDNWYFAWINQFITIFNLLLYFLYFYNQI